MSFLTLMIIIIFCAFALLSFLTRNYRNYFKLYMVFGKKGSGKSTFLTSQAVKYIKKGWIVYTNMLDCAVNGVRLIDVNHLGDFVPEANSLLLLDEVGMIWDNRDFKNFRPAVRDFFKLQRHYKVVCILASQTWDIDKKLRDLTDGMYLFINVFNVFSVGKRIIRKIVLTESTSEAESRISENLKFAPIWNWKFIFIPHWKKYYNSFDVPYKPYLDYKVIDNGVDPLAKSEIPWHVRFKNMICRIVYRKPIDVIEADVLTVDECKRNPDFVIWAEENFGCFDALQAIPDSLVLELYEAYQTEHEAKPDADFVRSGEGECSTALLDSSNT